MCLPAVIFFFMFNYMPLPGIYVAFVKYNYRNGIFGSKFIGLDNFKFLATSGQLWTLTKNTILYNLAFIILGNMLAVFVAILLNEMQSKWFKKVSQTIRNSSALIIHKSVCCASDAASRLVFYFI